MDLYKILGVRRNASSQSIKKAFRNKAKKSHPDKGGDPEEFHNVKTAYDVLSDPERRRVYDETGQYESKPSDNEISQTAQLLFAALQELLSKTKDRIVYIDIIQELKKYFEQKIAERQKTIEEMQSIQSVLSEVSRRTTVDGDQFNYISTMLDNEVANINRAILENNNQIVIFTKCFDMLSHYKFDKKSGYSVVAHPPQVMNVIFSRGNFYGSTS